MILEREMELNIMDNCYNMKTLGLVYRGQKLGVVQKDLPLMKQMKPLPFCARKGFAILGSD